MKRIRVYGDSFAAHHHQPPHSWTHLLGQLCNLPVINNAIAGGSTEYAIKKLIDDIDSIEDDIVIFVSSTPGRLHFSHQQQERPETAAQYLHTPQDNGKDHSWYYQNKKHIEWWMVNRDHQLNRINHEAYMHLIRSIARSKPNSVFVIIPNSDHCLHISGGVDPTNFLITKTCLFQISENENVKEFPTWKDFTKYTKWDLRINHLTNPNLEILASLIFDCINKHDMSGLGYDKFNKHFLTPIRTKKQYEEYVSLGYLSHTPWNDQELSKVMS